jgi:small subunit ribosomal protein S3
MTRRSTKLLRLESSLYDYDPKEESWAIPIGDSDRDQGIEIGDLFELGSYFTSKHMSQKVNPISFRLNLTKTWDSLWYSNYKNLGTGPTKLQKDLYIRKYLEAVLRSLKLFLDKIQIKEHQGRFFVKLFIYETDQLQRRDFLINPKFKRAFKKYLPEPKESSSKAIEKEIRNPFYQLNSNLVDIKKVLRHGEKELKTYLGQSVHLSVQYQTDLGQSASLLSNYLVNELERPNGNFKKALRNSLSKIKNKKLIRGLRINCSGRLGRAPMAKMEWFKFGSIPLTRISAPVDYSYSMGKTKYGSFGIKVWLTKH